MGIVLIFASFIGFFIFFLSRNSQTLRIREAWIKASLILSLLIVASIEGFSYFSALTRNNLMIFWAAVIAFLVFTIPHNKSFGANNLQIIFKNKKINLLVLMIPGIFFVATFIIAIVAPPNNTDSMVYHMSRVAHWAQNHSVANYPTSTLRELYLNPFAEYSLLHTYLLSGSDRFVNLIQWFSYLNIAIGVSLITELISKNEKSQYLASLFAITIPQAILQSTSTQNDLTLSAFVIFDVFFILQFISKKTKSSIMFIMIATAISILTKSTSYIFLAPFLIWFAIIIFKERKKEFFVLSIYSTLLVLLIIGPFYLRNYSDFGNPLGPLSEISLYKNENLGYKTTLSNLIRNISINLTYTSKINKFEEELIAKTHKVLGISSSDPQTTWQNYKFTIPKFSANEDFSGSPLHIILLLITFVILIFFKRPHSHLAVGLMVSIIAAFVLFSWYLKWQPWNNRLELCLFILTAPLFGILFGSSKILTPFLICILFLSGFPYFVFNTTKPLFQDWNIFNLPRIEMMIRRKEILGPYINGAIYINDNSNCKTIGMDIENGYLEYPLWNMLVDLEHPKRNLTHINVSNESKSLFGYDNSICSIIAINQLEKKQVITYQNFEYTLSFFEQPVAVYIKKY